MELNSRSREETFPYLGFAAGEIVGQVGRKPPELVGYLFDDKQRLLYVSIHQVGGTGIGRSLKTSRGDYHRCSVVSSIVEGHRSVEARGYPLLSYTSLEGKP